MRSGVTAPGRSKDGNGGDGDDARRANEGRERGDLRDAGVTSTISTVELAGYRIHVGRGLLASVGERTLTSAPAHRVAIICDSNVGALYGARVLAGFGNAEASLLEIQPGESQKTRESWTRLTDRLLDTQHGRDTTIVALGGGVVGDLAGFVAATYMRGVPFVQVPTTLLAMVDASVGGKTGVDTRSGKNLVGAFHNPAVVLADPDVLATLPLGELRSGLAEAIKHAVIADASHLEELRRLIPALLAAHVAGSPATDSRGAGDAPEPNREPAASAGLAEEVGRMIARSVEIKAGVVRNDEREGGHRKILNFGHTIGHAVELLSGYSLLHGEAIAIGMVLEARLGEQLGVTGSGTANTLEEVVGAAGLPTALPAGMSASALVEAMRSDKKTRSGRHEIPLPEAIGRMAAADAGWVISVPEKEILAVLK